MHYDSCNILALKVLHALLDCLSVGLFIRQRWHQRTVHPPYTAKIQVLNLSCSFYIFFCCFLFLFLALSNFINFSLSFVFLIFLFLYFLFSFIPFFTLVFLFSRACVTLSLFQFLIYLSVS